MISTKTRFYEHENFSIELLQICLSNNVTKHIYFIDLDTNQIVMHTQTDIYSMNGQFIKSDDECTSED